jgi:adenylosuccinate synthase
MSLWVVVGGQFGSEGKGKIAACITQREQIDICIRCGGPNSGHSFVAENGVKYLVRQVPTGFVRPGTRLFIPAGALIDLEVLKSEIESLNLFPRVSVDRNAMIIEDMDRKNEADLKLQERLSSTLCGVGSAAARRALRGTGVRLAQDVAPQVSWLAPLLTDVSEQVNLALDRGRKVLVEGTQGFGLSLYHTQEYPKATCRDTTAAGFLSEVGLSPRLVSEIVIVFRTFPIRVAGPQAGRLRQEISWEQLQEESGYPHPIQEITSVTQKVRRIGRFDWDLAAAAVRVNRPTKLAINGLDYLSYKNAGVTRLDQLDEKALAFMGRATRELKSPVALWAAGSRIEDCSAQPFPDTATCALRK